MIQPDVGFYLVSRAGLRLLDARRAPVLRRLLRAGFCAFSFTFAFLPLAFTQGGSTSNASPNGPGESSQYSDPALVHAQSLLQQGKLEDAQNGLQTYLKVHPESGEAHFLLGHIFFQQIHAKAATGRSQSEDAAATPVDPHYQETKAKASLAEYTEGAKHVVPSAFDLKVVALDYVLLKDYVDADKWLTKSLTMNPADSQSWYYLGRTKYNEDRFEEAVRAFQEFLQRDPRSVKGEDNLGLSYQGLGRTVEAVAAFKMAIAWQQNTLDQDAGPFLDLGSLLLEANQPQEAMTYLQQAAKIAPNAWSVHEQLGKAYERTSDLLKAQFEYESAVSLSPEHPRLHYILGQVYRKQGLAEKAKKEFERSEALRGTHSSEDEPER